MSMIISYYVWTIRNCMKHNMTKKIDSFKSVLLSEQIISAVELKFYIKLAMRL